MWSAPPPSRVGATSVTDTDKNIPFQQNVREYRLAIVVIDKQQWPDVRAHVGLVVAAVACAKGGCIDIVHIPV
jgi:hypothetical protein